MRSQPRPNPRPHAHQVRPSPEGRHEGTSAAGGWGRSGLSEQTLTVNWLGVTGSLVKTVESTNPVEFMIETVRTHARG